MKKSICILMVAILFLGTFAACGQSKDQADEQNGETMLSVEFKSNTVKFSQPEVYVDNLARNKSGHMSHAMTVLSDGKLIDFNSCCSAVRCLGHSAYGYIEYRISDDLGKTFSQPTVLPYSYDAYLSGDFTVSVEKAVTCSDGSVLAFCLRNTTESSVCCEPWLTPMAVRSRDAGMTWETPFEVSPYPGRIYDALCIGEKIIFLEFKNEHFLGEKPNHKFSVFISENNGESFSETELPIDGIGRGYGSLLFDGEKLHAYAYNSSDEHNMDHAVSFDFGKTWQLAQPCFLDCGIRNPQTALIDGVYVLHGRAGDKKGFAFYFSDDGGVWSKASIAGNKKGLCYYSNNVVLNGNGKSFLLVQYSELCRGNLALLRRNQVNVLHLTLEIEKTVDK